MENKKTILVVDDDADIRAVLSMRFNSAGYDVLEACDGYEAIKISREKKPDLIILDIMMPEMDGMSASQYLKEDPITKNIPIIFLTGLQDKKTEQLYPGVGENIIIAKPYDAKELLAAVKRVIG